LTNLLKSKSVDKTEEGKQMIWLCACLYSSSTRLAQLLHDCDQNTWLNFSSIFSEAAPHERCLNLPIDLIVQVFETNLVEKASQAPLEPIRRAIRYFDQLLNINAKSEKVVGNTTWLRRFLMKCEAISLFETEKVDLDASSGSNTTPEDVFMKNIRSIKRKMPHPDGNATCVDLSVPNFGEFDSALDKLTNDTELKLPINLSELISLSQNLSASLQLGHHDIYEKETKASNIIERANYFHQKFEENSVSTRQVAQQEAIITEYKQKISSLQEALEIEKVKSDMLKNQQTISLKQASTQEKELANRLRELEIQYQRDIKEKDKTLDSMQDEVEKLEKERQRNKSQQQFLGDKANLQIADISGKGDDGSVNISNIASNQRIATLELALLKTQREKQDLESKYLLDKVLALPPIKLKKRNVSKHDKIDNIRSRFMHLVCTPRLVKFDSKGRLPQKEKDLDFARDLQFDQLRKELNQAMAQPDYLN